LFFYIYISNADADAVVHDYDGDLHDWSDVTNIKSSETSMY